MNFYIKINFFFLLFIINGASSILLAQKTVKPSDADQLSKEREEFQKEKELFQKEKEEFEKSKKLEVKNEDATEEDFFKLEEDISIVSKRVGQSESTSKTSAIVSVYSRQKIIDSGARNLVDILKQAPGVEVFYDQFGFYKVAFRGIRSRSGVLMLLDGHRINNFYDGSTFLDIRADAIEKVEIIRGPGSSVHGTNAFVGVINVITRNPGKSNKSGGTLSSRGGQNNTIEPTAYYNLNMGSDWNLTTYAGQYISNRPSVNVKYDDTCNPTEWKTGKCNLTLPAIPINSGLKTDDHKKQTNVFLKMQKGELFYVSAKAITESKGPNLGELRYVTPDSELNFGLLTGDIGTQKISVTEKLSFSARVYGDSYNRKDNIQTERKDFLSHYGVDARKKTGYKYGTTGAEIIAQYNPFGSFFIILGSQYEKLSVNDFYFTQNYQKDKTQNLLPFYYDVTLDGIQKNQNGKRTIKAQFLQVQWEPLKWLAVTAGIRRDNYSDFGTSINPKGGVVITPFEHTKYGSLSFKLLYGSAFRAPTFQELYDQTQTNQNGGVVGNRNLKAEIIQTGEIGMEYQTPYKPFSFLTNAFYNKISRNIEGINTASSASAGPDDKFRNLRGISVHGFEAEFRFTYSTRNYAFANASWFEALDYGGLPPNTSKDTKTFLLDVPQSRANIGINLEATKYFIVNNTVWISGERASNTRYPFEQQSARSFRLPQYHIWNISIATTEDLVKNMEFRFSIFNALNFKLYDDINTSTIGFFNRSFPSSFLWERYMELKLSYFLN